MLVRLHNGKHHTRTTATREQDFIVLTEIAGNTTGARVDDSTTNSAIAMVFDDHIMTSSVRLFIMEPALDTAGARSLGNKQDLSSNNISVFLFDIRTVGSRVSRSFSEPWIPT
jgi:hypothetical protein